jgi:hypothetical protein
MQFCLISSSFDIKISRENKVKELDGFKKDVLKWLDKAFEGRNNGALNGVNTISEKTGLSLEKCIQIRKHLSELKVNGGFALSADQGFCRANYPKDFIRNFIINH